MSICEIQDYFWVGGGHFAWYILNTGPSCIFSFGIYLIQDPRAPSFTACGIQDSGIYQIQALV